MKSFLLPLQTKHQVKQKTIVKIHLLCRVKYCLQYRILGKVKCRLYKKIITNVKNPQHLDSFHLSAPEIGGRNCIRRYWEIPKKHSLHKKFVRWHCEQCPRQLRDPSNLETLGNLIIRWDQNNNLSPKWNVNSCLTIHMWWYTDSSS